MGFLSNLFAATGKSRSVCRASESCDLHEIATAWEFFASDRLLPFSAMDQPGALL
jgi:hypothetical protein